MIETSSPLNFIIMFWGDKGVILLENLFKTTKELIMFKLLKIWKRYDITKTWKQIQQRQITESLCNTQASFPLLFNWIIHSEIIMPQWKLVVVSEVQSMRLSEGYCYWGREGVAVCVRGIHFASAYWVIENMWVGVKLRLC